MRVWKRTLSLAPGALAAVLASGCDGTPSGFCTYTLSLRGAPAPPAGAGYGIDVFTDPGCAWTFQSNDPWLTLGPDPDNTGGAPGNGPGALELQVAANTGVRRVGTLTIASQTVTIDQAGTNGSQCTFVVSPVEQTFVGGTASASGFVIVPRPLNCGWSVSRSAVLEDTVRLVGGGSGAADLRYGVGLAHVTYEVKADSPTSPWQTGELILFDTANVRASAHRVVLVH
jgi:hypothetical protein